jgi:hypothetical protein
LSDVIESWTVMGRRGSWTVMDRHGLCDCQPHLERKEGGYGGLRAGERYTELTDSSRPLLRVGLRARGIP